MSRLWADLDWAGRSYVLRICFWVAMVPVAVALGWHTSVFLIFLYSTYANVIGEVDGLEARRARKAESGAS